MRFLIALLCVALLLTTRTADARPPTTHDTATMIYHYAAVYGVEAGDLLRLAQCESRLQPYPRDGSAGEVGPFQFHPRGLWRSTPWAAYGFNALRDPELNVRAAAWAIANGYGPHWSCWAIRYNYDWRP